MITDERAARFVAARLGYALCPPYTQMGLERDGEIIAGVVFNCFEGYNVHLTVAGHGWTPEFTQAVGEYAYGTLGCLRMTLTTEKKGVARLARKFGGKVEGVMRDHFGPNRDAIIVGILRRDWKPSKV